MKSVHFLCFFVFFLLPCELYADDSIACPPGKDTCRDCYSKLVDQITGRDENLFSLQSQFFPPETTSPFFLTVYYYFGDDPSTCEALVAGNETAVDDDDYTVWFWSTTSFYLIQPIHVFQYTSLFFSDTTSYASEVCLVLDPECSDAEDRYMKLLTQRVSALSVKFYFFQHCPCI